MYSVNSSSGKTESTQDPPVKVNLTLQASPQAVAEAIKTIIDTVSQLPQRREKAKLENEILKLRIEKQSLENLEYAIEVANKLFNIQYPNTDEAIVVVVKELQALLPSILLLSNKEDS